MTDSEGVETCRFCGLRLDLIAESKGGNHEKTCPEGPPPSYWDEGLTPKEWAEKMGYIIYDDTPKGATDQEVRRAIEGVEA